jgi:hypothetical protein
MARRAHFFLSQLGCRRVHCELDLGLKTRGELKRLAGYSTCFRKETHCECFGKCFAIEVRREQGRSSSFSEVFSLGE